MNSILVLPLVSISLFLIQLIVLPGSHAPADPPDTMLSDADCYVLISPTGVIMNLGDTQTFTASTICNGVHSDGMYTWSVDGGALDTSHGDTVMYTATEAGGLFTLQATDTANGNITSTAEIFIPSVDYFIWVKTTSVPRSLWIMIPAWIDIYECNCASDSFPRITYDPRGSILPLPPLLTRSHIKQLVLVMPVWFTGTCEETVRVTVTRKECGTASDTMVIDCLPYPL